MRHLIVIKLLLNKQNREKGVTLLEVVLVSVIVGIMAAMSVPNMLEEQRQQRVNETFNRIRGALVEAQINANRQSGSCTVVISSTQVSSYLHVDDDSDSSTDSTDDDGTTGLDPKPTIDPKSCNLEIVNIDDSIVDVRTSLSSGLPQNITFQYDGTLTATTLQTIHLKRKNAADETGKCIVIANNLGMIRTGIFDSSPSNSAKCRNVENERYTP